MIDLKQIYTPILLSTHWNGSKKLISILTTVKRLRNGAREQKWFQWVSKVNYCILITKTEKSVCKISEGLENNPEKVDSKHGRWDREREKERERGWAHAFLGIYSVGLKAYIYTKTCMYIFITALFTIAPNWKQLRYLSVGEWINGLIHAYKGILLRNLKKWAFKSWKDIKEL